MRLSLEGGQLIRCLEPDATMTIESSQDGWMPLADWLSEYPPIFYATDKSSFEGLNKIAAPLLRSLALAPGDAESIDWTGCAIEVEFCRTIRSLAHWRDVQSSMAKQLCRSTWSNTF